MKRIENEIIKQLSPLDLRAIYDLLSHLNRLFLKTDSDPDFEYEGDDFLSYFSEIDFSRMSDSQKSVEALKAIKNLKPEIKRLIFARIMDATQHLLFWKTEREIALYLLKLNFIGAKEIMMLNCSYVLRDLLPYDGSSYKFICDDFYDFNMTIENEEYFHCYISLNTKFVDQEGFVNIFIDYDTVKCIRSYLYNPEGSVSFISNQLDEKNYFKNHGNYLFSYVKSAPSGDAIRNGVWFRFYNIQFK